MNLYLVTGAAGFIGSAIARKLIAAGNKVVTIDNLSTGSVKNIPKECIFIEGNAYDANILSRLNEYSFDAIIHIAGQSSGEISFENPVYDLNTNTQSTLQLLDIAKKTGVKKFIYASSMSIYGDQNPELVSEKTIPVPKSFYAVGKLASENYMRIYSGFGINCTALRFFNVYGAGQNMDNLKQGMASIYLAMALKDRHIVVKGAKDRFRDFVYIDDVVEATICALNRNTGNAYECYNVCTQKKHTVEDVIQKIQSILTDEITIEYIAGTMGDQHGIYGDNTKICTELGWCPRFTFDEGMRKMIQWAQYKI